MKSKNTFRLTFLLSSLSILFCPNFSHADERFFTYSYEANVLPQGALEFEQWITNQSGKRDGDFSRWDFRSEIEYGVTDHYTSSLYLNWESTRIGGIEGMEDENNSKFKGFSWENIYQVLNPNLDPLGFALYGEFSSDAIDYEFEGKLLFSKPVEDFIFVANAIYEAEFEKEDGMTEREAELAFTLGASYKINTNWSVGLEARNVSAYPDGLDLNGQEFQAWSVGPNVHYANPKWWATFTVLPQVWGNGEDSSGNRQLVHEESLEARLIFGIDL